MILRSNLKLHITQNKNQADFEKIKAPILNGALIVTKLVAGAGFEPTTFRL
jgi:hypothetical protein